MTIEHNVNGDERADLLNALSTHRGFLRQTVHGLTDEQARLRTTVSELCLGGIIKHVTRAEHRWADFIVRGTQAIGPFTEAGLQAHADSFRMLDDDTLPELLDRYDDVARHTNDLVTSLPSLDVSHPLPEAPWYAPGACWSARRALLHIIGETAQHAGHADIIREALDGAKTMG